MAGLHEYLSALLATESGINPQQADWYQRHLHLPSVRYARVHAPGVLQRDAQSGEPVFDMISVAEYFARLGLSDLYQPDDVHSVRRMQYASINAWGFVGYQVGEAALIELGYYQPKQCEVEVDGIPCRLPLFYRGDVAAANWAGGVQQYLMVDEASGERMLASPVNTWSGHFTGKDGLHSLTDLRCEHCQECIILELMLMNAQTVLSGLEALGQRDALPFRLQTPEGTVLYLGWSAILAACHLSGALGTLKFLSSGQSSQDELGTTTLSYMQGFAAFEFDLDAIRQRLHDLRARAGNAQALGRLA